MRSSVKPVFLWRNRAPKGWSAPSRSEGDRLEAGDGCAFRKGFNGGRGSCGRGREKDGAETGGCIIPILASQLLRLFRWSAPATAAAATMSTTTAATGVPAPAPTAAKGVAAT